MATGDIGDWYRSIPQISRYWFTGSVVLPLIGKMGLVSPMTMILDFESVIKRFQIWRPFTAAFYYPLNPQTGFHYLMNLYFLYSYSTRLETGVFSGTPADYAFLLLFNWIILTILGLFVTQIYLLMDPLVLSVLYIWCQLNRDQVVSFWFGTQFKAMYLPWILFGFNLILGSGGITDLLGIVVGHLYFFLMFKYPQDFGGRRFLQVPQILYKFLPNQRGGVAGFGMAPRTRAEPRADGGRHNWGQGQQLGGN